MFIIAARELRSLFLSPLAWTILAVIQFILAYIFLANVDVFIRIQPQLAKLAHAPGFTELVISNFFGTAAVVLLFVVPLLTMRLFSEERRYRTLTLLLSSPLSLTEIVLGKYLGLMGFLSLLLFMLSLMPLSLFSGGVLDWGQCAAGMIGLWLLLAAFSAAGLFASTLTAQPAVAALGAFGILFLLWIIDWDSQMQSGLLRYLSLFNHYQALLKGLFKTQDVIYFLLFILTFLSLSVSRLDAERM